MLSGTKIEEKLEVNKFIELISKYPKEQIECTSHTFFRLSQKQREIFNSEELRKILLNEKPFLVGIQHNENYAVFYKHQNKILKIILGINHRKVNIVTFYFIEEWQIPKI
ncbi:MAG: hypothetical protein AABX30_02565 [Nanoarchaeota archaeon]